MLNKEIRRKNMKNRSSLILRTNPRLTGNAKIVVDSKGIVRINSIPVNDILSDSSYNKIINPESSDYSEDLYNLFNKVPNTIFYEIGKLDDNKIYSNLSEQFETIYNYGAEHCVSKLYEEQFKLFAPILIGKTLPKYFCIFKIDGCKKPIYARVYEENYLKTGVSYKVMGREGSIIFHSGNNYKVGDVFKATSDKYLVNKEYDSREVYCIIYDEKYESSFNYFSDFISPSNLIKVINFRDGNIGKYISNLQKHPLYSKSPIEVDYSDKTITYNGISITKGNIISVKESIENLMENEKPIKLFDEYVTEGFFRNNLVYHNLLNIEFMFDDSISDDFTTNRYYGFYTDDIKFHDFSIEKLEELFLNQQNMLSSSSGYFVVKNPYDEITKVENLDVFNEKIIKEIQKEENCYTLETQQSVEKLENFGIPSICITKRNEIQIGCRIKIYIGNNYIESITADTLKNLVKGDYGYDQWNLNGFLFSYFNPVGKTDEKILQRLGESIMWALKAVKIFSYKYAVNDNKLYIYSVNGIEPNIELILDNCKNESLELESNKLIGYSPSKSYRFKIKKIDKSTYEGDNCYIKTKTNKFSKISSISNYLDNIKKDDNNVILNPEDNDNFLVVAIEDQNDQVLFNNGYISVYRKKDFNFGCFDICDTEDLDYDFYSESYSSSYESEYYRYYAARENDLEIGCQYNLYKSDGDDETSIECEVFEGKETVTKIIKTSKNDQYRSFSPTTKSYKIISGKPVIIRSHFAKDKELVNFAGFNSIRSRNYDYKVETNIWKKITSFPSKQLNEYEVLKENENIDLAYLSKTTPVINKWVMEEQDIRGNNYRFNISPSFGKTSFSPSFNIYNPDPLNFTSEWYYISSYPHGLSDEEIYNSTSYFDHLFDVKQHSSFSYDYFLNYFTIYKCTVLEPDTKKKLQDKDKDGNLLFDKDGNTVWKKDQSGNDLYQYDNFGKVKYNYKVKVKNVKFQQRYSLISKKINDDNDDNYQTFFRGVLINFNSPKVNLSDYKFSCILNLQRTSITNNNNSPLQIEFSRNDKFKNIVMVITIHVDDYKVIDDNGFINCGYLYLYIMNHLQSDSGDSDKLRYGMQFKMKKYENQEIFTGGRGAFDKQPNELEKFNDSIIYGSKLYMSVGTKYSDDGENNTSILQFNDNYFQFVDWYKNNELGSYSDIIGLRDDFVVFTKPIAYDFNKRYAIIDNTQSNIIGYDKKGIQLSKVSSSLSEDNSRRLSYGGLSVASSSNFTPIMTKTTSEMRRMLQLNLVNWIEIGGGFNYYKKLSQLLTFSSISDLVHKNSGIISYYKCENGDVTTDYNFGNITFIKPSEIVQQKTLQFIEDNRSLSEYPNELMINYKIEEKKNIKDTFYRYSGKFYPKTNIIISFNDISRDLSWEEELRKWKQIGKIWKNEYKDKDDIEIDVDDYKSGSNINNDRLYQSFIFSEKNMLIMNNPVIKNMFYHKVSNSGNKIINTDLSAYERNKEININKKDIEIFKSMYDVDYFHDYPLSIKDYNKVGNFSDYKNIKTFFGSCLTKLPHEFDFGDYEKIIDLNVDKKEIDKFYSLEINTNNNTITFTIDLNEAFYEKFSYFIKKGLDEYVSEVYVKNNDIDNYIRNYSIQNLIQNYIISSISLYIKENINQVSDFIMSEDNHLTMMKYKYLKEKNAIISNPTKDNKITISYKITNENYKYKDYSYGILINMKIK